MRWLATSVIKQASLYRLEPFSTEEGIALIQNITGNQTGYHFSFYAEGYTTNLYGADFKEVNIVPMPSNGSSL